VLNFRFSLHANIFLGWKEFVRDQHTNLFLLGVVDAEQKVFLTLTPAGSQVLLRRSRRHFPRGSGQVHKRAECLQHLVARCRCCKYFLLCHWRCHSINYSFCPRQVFFRLVLYLGIKPTGKGEMASIRLAWKKLQGRKLWLLYRSVSDKEETVCVDNRMFPEIWGRSFGVKLTWPFPFVTDATDK
jgi:hypothetical protein